MGLNKSGVLGRDVMCRCTLWIHPAYADGRGPSDRAHAGNSCRNRIVLIVGRCSAVGIITVDAPPRALDARARAG